MQYFRAWGNDICTLANSKFATVVMKMENPISIIARHDYSFFIEVEIITPQNIA